MSFTGTITRAYSDGNGALTKSESVTGTDFQGLDLPVPAPSTALAFSFAVAHAKIQSLVINADQTLAVHLQTGSSPITITINPGCPYIISPATESPSLITSDVLSGTVDNASGTAATLQIRCIYNN